jgi:histidyl-tRNA synthetase
MRDFPPELARKKQFVEDTCRKVFEKYGFEYIETPVLEELQLLNKKGSSGSDVRKELYSFTDKGGRELGLRFDLTVPMARFVVNNPQIPKPFKRYQIGNAYRYDRPQKGRYRTFTQADVDIIGIKNMIAEFEIIALSIELMDRLEIPCTIIINNRNLLENVALNSGVQQEQISECFRLIDKLDKIGEENVEAELNKAGISTDVLNRVKENDLSQLPDCEGKKDMEELVQLIKENGLEKRVRFQLSLARGLDYYTGTVFEVVGKGPSLAAGGRYDKLIASFGGPPTPSMGISFGVDRLLDISEKEIVGKPPVYVVPIGKTQNEALQIATALRKQDMPVSMDLAHRGLSKNLDYAKKKGFLFVLILGENEVKSGSVTIRNMQTGEQKEVKQSELENAFE